MEYRLVYAQDPHRHMLHTARDKHQRTPGQESSFPVDRDFDLCVQIIGIVGIAAEEPDQFVLRMGMFRNSSSPVIGACSVCTIY